MQPIRTRSFAAFLAAALVAGLALVVASTMASRSADDDVGILAGLISRALSTPSTQVSIGAVEGALSSDASVRDITISDRDGVWLELDRARLIWRRTALLLGRLEIDRLEIGNLTIHRRPVPSEEEVPGADQPILPELPVKVEIKEFTLAQLALGEPVIGVAARLGAKGNASLGNPSEGLDLSLEARRLDAAGELTARLSLVPQTQRLDLRLVLDEPAEGLFVHLANVPGHPPAKLELDGSGTLDAFAAKLAFDAGDSIGATGAAQLRREGAGRRLALDLDARIEGLLPALAAPVFAGTTALDGSVLFADSGAIDIAALSVVSQTARLDVKGQLSDTQVADIAIAARALPNDGARTRAGAAEIGKLAFDATVTGPMLGPRVAATLAVEDARLPQGRLAKLDADFTATPSGAVTDAANAIPFAGKARATGLAPRDPALARALGNEIALEFAGTFKDRVAAVDKAQLRTSTARAQFAGDVGGPRLRGRLDVDAPDLSRFGGIAGLQLRGALTLAADLDGVPDQDRIAAALDGNVERFASGIAALDGIAGGRIALNGAIRKLPKGGYGFGDLRLTGAHGRARLDGEATVAQAAIDARMAVDDLARADRRLSGRAEATARLTGIVTKPDATATITITEARALGRPVPRLVVDANVKDLTGALEGRVTLAGRVDGKEARGDVRLAKLADGGWRLDTLDVAVGSVSARGALTLDAATLAAGNLAIAADDLDDLSPLVLTRLAGRLKADLDLAVVNGGQDASLAASGEGMKFGTAAVERLQARAQLTDLYRRPIVDGDIAVDRAVIAGEAISQIRLLAKGTPNASDVTLTAKARGFAVDAAGRVVPADNIRLELAKLTAQRGNHRLALASPATFTLVDGGVAIDGLAVALGAGRLAVDGRVAEAIDLSVNARAVPLAVAEIAVPGIGLAGTLDGEAKIAGTTSAPTGDWRVRIARLTAAQTRDAGLPPMDIAAQGRLADEATSVDATVRAGEAGNLRIAGTVPLQGEGLDLAVTGRLDLGVANRTLGVAGRRVAGRADIDLRVRRSLALPEVSGSASLANGSYDDATLGLSLTAISGRFAARGEEIAIERLTAQTPGGGTLGASGQVRIDPAAGFPGQLRLQGRRAKLMANQFADAVADLDIALAGPLARDPDVSGRVTILSMNVSIPERLPATLRPLPETRHVNVTPTARARLALDERTAAGQRRAPAFDAGLDLQIDAPNRIFVRGRGIDAELGGQLRLTGRLADPVTVGAFDLRRGRMQVGGTRLDITRGRLAFTGNLTPDLDLVAETRAADVTAYINVTGPASEPTFAFTSSPDLPQDEILSRILFAKASGGLSPVQALQLAQVAAQFSGGGGGGAFERLRQSLGVDSLDISTSATGDPTVGVSRAINNRISVGVKTGARPEDSGVSVDIDVTRRLRVQGHVGQSGATSVGIGAEWEY